jgi:hypothetical protein
MGKNKTATIKVINPTSKKLQSVRFVTSGYTLYFNSQHHLIKLTAKERCFFDYLCEHMRPSTNDIMIDSNQKESFVRHYESCTSQKLNVVEVSKYAPKLKSLSLLLDTSHKALYIVNPKYVFKGAENARLKYLQALIENRPKEGLSVSSLINVPKDEFGG